MKKYIFISTFLCTSLFMYGTSYSEAIPVLFTPIPPTPTPLALPDEDPTTLDNSHKNQRSLEENREKTFEFLSQSEPRMPSFSHELRIVEI